MTQTWAERFWAKVDRGPTTDQCWLWMGNPTRDGYGSFKLNGASVLAHRVSYSSVWGPIPSHLEVDHLCRTPLCVNPHHLECVTHRENIRRGLLGRLNYDPTRCHRGHTLRGEGRRCRECDNVGHKTSYARDPEGYRARARVTYARNREAILDRKRAAYARNRESIRARQRAYRARKRAEEGK